MRAVGTSTGPAEIITDAGPAFLKALGNKEGPHVLAAEWIGTVLADWFGLKTFSIAQMRVSHDDEIPLGHNRSAEVGTAIALRTEEGSSWGGTTEELKAAVNVSDVGRFVVFDTWLRNCDRYPADLAARKPNYGNVFLSADGAEKGKFVLKAIDHTHCFLCGRDLAAGLTRIDHIKDQRFYGLFPEFKALLDPSVLADALNRLGSLDPVFVRNVVDEIAADWQVTAEGRDGLVEMITRRAGFVATMNWESIF